MKYSTVDYCHCIKTCLEWEKTHTILLLFKVKQKGINGCEISIANGSLLSSITDWHRRSLCLNVLTS